MLSRNHLLTSLSPHPQVVAVAARVAYLTTTLVNLHAVACREFASFCSKRAHPLTARAPHPPSRITPAAPPCAQAVRLRRTAQYLRLLSHGRAVRCCSACSEESMHNNQNHYVLLPHNVVAAPIELQRQASQTVLVCYESTGSFWRACAV